MRVAELRAILAHLPDDLPVVLSAKQRQHVGVVQRNGSGVAHRTTGMRKCDTCGKADGYEHQTFPHHGYVELRPPDGYGVPWNDFGLASPEPAIQIKGAIRDRAGLSAELDALNPLASEP